MATATELQARIDAINTALSTGALVVRQGEESIQYRSFADMKEIRADMQGQLNELNAVKSHRVVKIYQTDKGL